MEYALIISRLIIGCTGIFFIKKHRERNEKVKKTRDIQSRFKSSIIVNPSIFQTLVLSKDNDIFSKLYTIITLKKDFCLSQLFLSEQSETIILKGYLKKKIANFYINNVRMSGKHYARKYTTKQSNIKKYCVYGTVNNNVREFCLKYAFAHLYCSYWPTEMKLVDNIENSVVYLEGPLDLLSQEFIEDFFNLFRDVETVPVKMYENELKKFNEEQVKIKEYEKKDFMERIVNDINKNSTKGIVIKKKGKRNK